MRISRGLWRLFFLPLAIVVYAGCAVQYYDPVTQTDHLWGFGHFRMKVAPASEGVQAIVKSATVVGANVKIAADDTHVTVGWDRSTQMAVMSEGASVRLEWPNNNLFNMRVGSRPPFLPNSDQPDSKPAETRKGED